MSNRLKLQRILEIALGSSNVYFQPPVSIRLKYPCIIYERSYQKISHASNFPYRLQDRYTVTVIDSNPDSQIPYEVAKIQTCAFDRQFVSDNLYHTVYTIYC